MQKIILSVMLVIALALPVKAENEEAQELIKLGENYWELGKKKQAIKLFKKAAKLDPDYADVHFLLGRGYFFQGKHENAINEFGIFKEKMDSLPEMDEYAIDFYTSRLHKISYLYSSLRRYDLMMVNYKKILELDAGDEVARFNLAICYYQRRKKSRAYNNLQKIIKEGSSFHMIDRAKLLIDYIRRNPDPRFMPDDTFVFDD